MGYRELEEVSRGVKENWRIQHWRLRDYREAGGHKLDLRQKTMLCVFPKNIRLDIVRAKWQLQ